MKTLISRPHAFRAGAAVAVLALALTGCGSDADKNSGPDAKPSGTQRMTHAVTHAMGTTEVPDDPQRVVVIDSPHLDALVALDVKPVGITVSAAGEGAPPYLADELEGVPSVGLTVEPGIDDIAALDPDLIIGAKVRHEAIYDELSAIAPTVFSVDSGTNWREQAEITAEAVNRSDEMEGLLTRLDERIRSVGKEIGAEGMSASMVRFRPDNFRLYGPDTFSGSILSGLGYDLGERDWNEYSMLELSPENFQQIDGDIVFYTNPGGDPTATTMAPVTKLWGDQPGVKAGRTLEFDDETWMVGIGVVGANQILDDLSKHLG